MSVYADISHQRKLSGSNKSPERTSYTHAPLKHVSNQKYVLLSLKRRYI